LLSPELEVNLKRDLKDQNIEKEIHLLDENNERRLKVLKTEQLSLPLE